MRESHASCGAGHPRLAQRTDFTDLARMNEIDGEETDIEVSNSLIAKVARSSREGEEVNKAREAIRDACRCRCFWWMMYIYVLLALNGETELR